MLARIVLIATQNMKILTAALLAFDAVILDKRKILVRFEKRNPFGAP